MTVVPITIKHGGKAHPLELDTTWSVPELREKIYDLTRVTPAQQKVLIKGTLKDDADLSKLGLKNGQQVMVVGPAGEIPKAPVQQMKFLEDMDASELAQAMKIPAGLQNLGNTCWMNSTVQVLGRMPELRQSLSQYSDNISSSSSDRRVAACLRDLYTGLDKSTDDYPPLAFWQMLRMHNPTFNQQERGHFAQQDAEEGWSTMVTSLRSSLGDKYVEKYMGGRLRTETKSVEAPDEEASVREETFFNLTCSINSSTNYLSTGLKEGFVQQIEKNSPSLGRNAMYTSTSSVNRAPTYLTIHLNRFFWRPDIRKKTKIMRKVKFPFELDATELFSEELKKRTQGVNARLKEVEKDRAERKKVAKRDIAKNNRNNQGDTNEDDWMSEEEKKKRVEEKEELLKLVDPAFKDDEGACTSGLYDLIGIVTHKGASADGGHYIGWAKNTEKDNSWFKFDDAKVSVVDDNAITGLDGGGEGSTAYLLLYSAKKFA